MTEQLDMFTLLAADEEARNGLPRLFSRSHARPADYRAAFEAWTNDHGHFGSLRITHAWLPDYFAPVEPTTTCQATVLNADLGCHHYREHCECVGSRVYRGACTGCPWHGEIRTTETVAVADALDHTHPRWRDLPVVDEAPLADGTRRAAARLAHWVEKVLDTYGEQTPGCPVITRRTPPGTRSVPDRSPWNGYDIAASSLTPASADDDR